MDAVIKQVVKEELRSIGTSFREQADEAGISQNQPSNRTVNRLSGLIARIRKAKSDDHGPTKAKKKKSAVKEHRIQVRWHHYDKTTGKYISVRQKNGGGNRFIEYLSSDPPTLPDLLRRASDYYFPDGKNRFAGQLNNLKKAITDSAGDIIIDFPEEGTVSDYLNARGMYPSSTFFCLRTELADEQPLPLPSLVSSESESVDHPFMVSDNEEFPLFFMEDVEEPIPVRVTCDVCFTTHEFGEECIRCQQNQAYEHSLLAENKSEEVKHEMEEIVDLEQIRAHRVAYLTGNLIPAESSNQCIISHTNEASDCEITSVHSNVTSETVPPVGNLSAGHQPREVAGIQPEQFKVLKVRRSFLQKDMIAHFKDDACMSVQLTFTIINDTGKDEMGAGVGVTREVFTLFWKHFANAMTIGERERVPFVRHDHFINEWEAVARILVRGYEMISYFPTFLSKAFMSYCLFGREVPDSIIVESFMKYLSSSEEELVREYMTRDSFPDNIEDQEEFLDFLERFKCRTVVKKENINNIITEIGQQELMQKPHLMVATWQPILQKLKNYPHFQTLSALNVFYDNAKPTTKRILRLLDANPSSDAERDAFRFLQQYVRGLDGNKVLQFLRFVTATDILISGKIQVTFIKSEGAARRPIAHTCGPVLEIPSTYSNYCEFREEFNNILDQDSWEIDIV